MPRETPAALLDALDCFQAWRRSRRSGSRIPDHLWDLAVQMAQDYGLNRVCTILKLDYDALKKRLPASEPETPATPTFIELTPTPLNLPAECLIELARPDGHTMRLHLKGYQTTDLLALADPLWNHR